MLYHYSILSLFPNHNTLSTYTITYTFTHTLIYRHSHTIHSQTHTYTYSPYSYTHFILKEWTCEIQKAFLPLSEPTAPSMLEGMGVNTQIGVNEEIVHV